MLKAEKIENYSGVKLQLGCIPSLKKGNWKELDLFPAGDAPKNFIAIYQYEKDSKIRKLNSDTWARYIAKVGHKWYPIESINEYLFNQIGEVLKLKMASSQLIMAGEQLRFLSKYFLTKRYSLVHGAEIFAGYLENDLKFVEKVEEDKLARSLFTFQFAEKAIRKMFPKEAEHILTNFVEMIVFDALTGNNDRHFYNWGVIKHVENKKNAIFAPVYDSARGLFWNDSESKLLKLFEQPKQIDEKIKKYSEQSRPKIGWEGLEELNHFDLVDKIYSSDSRYREVCAKLITQDNLEKSLNLVNVSFSKFYSSNRIELIRKCLTYRFERLRNIVK